MTVQEIFNTVEVREIEIEIISIIEEDAKHRYSNNAYIEHLLSERKCILDSKFVMDANYKSLLSDFNEALMAQAKEMRKRAIDMHNANINCGKECDIETTGKCFLGYKYSSIHPVQTMRAKKIWNILNGSYREFMPLYYNGACSFSISNNEKPESNFFIKSDEVLKLQDGSSVAVNNNWSKEDFEKIVSWAKQYDVEVADFKPSKPFEQGGFTLEYLNGYVPLVPEKNNSKWWLWLVLAAVIIIVLILMLMRSCNKEPEVIEVEKIVTETVTVHDTVTVYLEQIEEIEKNFNAAQFAVGKADLNDDAKFVLHDLVKILEKQPQVNLKIVGHTSDEGDAKFNQKLSENRAKAVVDFLISRGIAADRLQYEGKGSSEPLDPNNRDVNRRTQIIVEE